MIRITLITLYLCCLLCSSALAKDVWKVRQVENLWEGLIAESVSDGYNGMYATACVVRNRLHNGLNTGLVALKRKDLHAFVKRQGVKYEYMAKDIVSKVFQQNSKDITRGATHYENINRYGIPRWAKNMVITIKIGEHTFYK